MIRKQIFAIGLVAGLGACGGDTAPSEVAGEDASARGEVLGGTISDSMIPLDEVKSRAPALKASPAARSSGDDSSSSAEPAETGESEQAAAPAAEDTAPELPED